MENSQRKLKFLDLILKALVNSPEHILYKRDINQKVYKAFYNFGNDGKTFVAYIEPSDELGNALNYLVKNQMIEKIGGNIYKITYEGILKESSGGYVQEYENKLIENAMKKHKNPDVNISITGDNNNLSQSAFGNNASVNQQNNIPEINPSNENTVTAKDNSFWEKPPVKWLQIVSSVIAFLVLVFGIAKHFGII